MTALSKTNPLHNPPQTVAAALVAVALAKHGDEPAAWIERVMGCYIDTITRARDLLVTDPTDAIYTASQLDTAEVTAVVATAYAVYAVNALPHDLEAITADKEASISALKAAGL